MRLFMRNMARWLYYTISRPLINRRRAYRKSMPYVTLEHRHLENLKALPDRKELLRRMPASSIAAEFGVAGGEFSGAILGTCEPKKLYLVDVWDTNQYRPFEEAVRTRFSKEISSGLIEIRKNLSLYAMADFPDDHFDWIYIDTNHSYETTARELLAAERIVKTGGRILGHDYCLGNIVKPAVFGVVQAVNEFCVNRDWFFEYITLESHGHLSYCLKRREDELPV